MRTFRLLGPGFQITILAGLSAIAVSPALLHGQEQPRTGVTTTSRTLTLDQAREIARRVGPELTAAREAVAVAAGRERQAGAFPNPTISYQREQTSGDGQTNSQNIASIDQPIELGGARGARVAVAQFRRQVAEARLAAAQAQLDHDVTRAYALAVAADRRATLAEQAASAFGRARTVSQARLVQGDVSGYSHRRIQLEAARYAGLFAEARLERRKARLALASLLASPADSATSIRDTDLTLEDSLFVSAVVLSDDSLHVLAARHRAELRVATLEAGATAAEARLAARERLPVPTLTAGIKNEQVVGGDDFSGFVASVSLPLPLWDRRRGAIEAASAESRRRVAEVEVVRRRIAREVVEAAAALRAVDEQLDLLRPQLGAESQAALRAAQVAHSEGEISLVEWLDVVRAYQEAEATFASLRAESLIRRAALERAVGVPLARVSR
jgi:cobalt-zinc-cadmium efflux system outer membrane protein